MDINTVKPPVTPTPATAARHEPAFAEPLHVGRPNIGDEEMLLSLIKDMVGRRWLSNNGPLVREFEARLAEFLGVRHVICVCNATVGLEIVIRALDLSGEIIIPSFTAAATAHAVQWQQITPLFCDIDPKTHNLDPNRVEDLITPRTTGILGVHIWGRPCDIDALEEIARRRNLKLMFDAAHAFACTYQGKMIGAFGEAEVLSFHATKFFNTFEGGAVTTNNDNVAEKIRSMKNFGFSGIDKFIQIGTNGKMSEASAAMGLTNMESLDYFIDTNRRNYYAYRDGLADLPGVTVIDYPEHERNNYHYVIVEIDEQQAGVSRNELVNALRAENVLARRYFYPGCHQMEPYRSYYPHARLLLPETERLVQRVMALPTGTAVSLSDIELVCDLIRREMPRRQ